MGFAGSRVTELPGSGLMALLRMSGARTGSGRMLIEDNCMKSLLPTVIAAGVLALALPAAARAHHQAAPPAEHVHHWHLFKPAHPAKAAHKAHGGKHHAEPAKAKHEKHHAEKAKHGKHPVTKDKKGHGKHAAAPPAHGKHHAAPPARAKHDAAKGHDKHHAASAKPAKHDHKAPAKPAPIHLKPRKTATKP